MNWLHRRRNKKVESAPPPSSSELRLANAIESAHIMERHGAGEDGELEPRIYVTCPALRGAFWFSPEETERRIRKSFPDLGDKTVTASVRHLADRVAIRLTEKSGIAPGARRNWVRDWAADKDEFFRI